MSQLLNDLSPQKRMWVLEYLKDFKQCKAAERIGLSGSVGSTWLGLPEVQEAISEQMEERVERTQIDADWVLEELAKMFSADLADIFKPGTDTLRPIHEWPSVWRKMCSGIKVNEMFSGSGDDRALIGYVKDIKIIDRLKSLDMIGKHTNVKAFTERLEVTSDQDLIERLNAGRKRARQINKEDDDLSFM